MFGIFPLAARCWRSGISTFDLRETTKLFDFLPPHFRPSFPFNHLGPVVRSMVSANHRLSSIKINRLSWYLTLVSANQASSNSALDDSSFSLALYELSHGPLNFNGEWVTLLLSKSNQQRTLAHGWITTLISRSMSKIRAKLVITI